MESEEERAREERAARRIIEQLKEREAGKEMLARLKYKVCKEEGLTKVLKDHEVARHLRGDEGWLREFLRGKRVRGASGIYTVAVMTKPLKCPKERSWRGRIRNPAELSRQGAGTHAWPPDGL